MKRYLLDQHVEVLWDLWGEAYRGEFTLSVNDQAEAVLQNRRWKMFLSYTSSERVYRTVGFENPENLVACIIELAPLRSMSPSPGFLTSDNLDLGDTV